MYSKSGNICVYKINFIPKNMTSGITIIENHQLEHCLLSPGRVFALHLQKNNNLITTILMISSIINKRGIFS